MSRSVKHTLTAVIFAFALVLVSGASNTVNAQSCEATTDAQIVAAIYEEIAKDSNLASQTSHINVVSINKAVKLQGWTDTQKDYDNLYDIRELRTASDC